MALVYRAELRPSKLELLNPWIIGKAWWPGGSGTELRRVASYRFDDPAGEVGVETLLLRAGDGPVLQIPLTYRGAPLEGAEEFLIGTLEHSVLGSRWVYDGCGDPVYVATLLGTMLTGGGEAPEFVDFDGEPRLRETPTSVRGSGDRSVAVPAVKSVTRVVDGDPTVVGTEAGELSVVRVLGEPLGGTRPVTLTGTFEGQDAALLLAYA